MEAIVSKKTRRAIPACVFGCILIVVLITSSIVVHITQANEIEVKEIQPKLQYLHQIKPVVENAKLTKDEVIKEDYMDNIKKYIDEKLQVILENEKDQVKEGVTNKKEEFEEKLEKLKSKILEIEHKTEETKNQLNNENNEINKQKETSLSAEEYDRKETSTVNETTKEEEKKDIKTENTKTVAELNDNALHLDNSSADQVSSVIHEKQDLPLFNHEQKQDYVYLFAFVMDKGTLVRNVVRVYPNGYEPTMVTQDYIVQSFKYNNHYILLKTRFYFVLFQRIKNNFTKLKVYDNSEYFIELVDDNKFCEIKRWNNLSHTGIEIIVSSLGKIEHKVYLRTNQIVQTLPTAVSIQNECAVIVFHYTEIRTVDLLIPELTERYEIKDVGFLFNITEIQWINKSSVIFFNNTSINFYQFNWSNAKLNKHAFSFMPIIPTYTSSYNGIIAISNARSAYVYKDYVWSRIFELSIEDIVDISLNASSLYVALSSARLIHQKIEN